MPSVHTIKISETTFVVVLQPQTSIKLTCSNYPAWKVRFNASMVGYDLLGFVDGTKIYPAQTHADHTYWQRQDKLILHVIISSVDHSIITMLGNVTTCKQAWDILHKMFASKTRSPIMHLKERLSRFSKGTQSVTEYLQTIKSMSDELTVINSPLDDVDLIIHTLNGLGSKFKEITTTLRARENPIEFDALHDLLIDYESHLNRDEDTSPIASAHAAYKGKQHFQKRGYTPNHAATSQQFRSDAPGSSKKVTCPYCDKQEHTAKECYKLHGYLTKNNFGPSAHHARANHAANPTDWILDLGATHHYR